MGLFSLFPRVLESAVGFSESEPSALYRAYLEPSKALDGSTFRYLGKVNIFSSRLNLPNSKDFGAVNPLLIPYAELLMPQRVVNGKILNPKYAYTTVYPLAEYKSIARFNNTVFPPLRNEWRQAEKMLSSAFACMGGSSILDFDDAQRWLDRTTSPGYPWQLAFQNKGELIDSDYWLPYYTNFEVAAKSGEDRTIVFRCFIKKSFEKIEKVLNDMPRTVLAAPAELTMLGNRLFGVMNAKLAMAGARHEAPVYVGLSKFNQNWNGIAVRLLFFPNIGDGDCAFFDGTVGKSAFSTVRELRKAFLAALACWKTAVNFFYAAIVYSIILGIMGDLFQKMMGQPSGQTNTLIDNCMIHCLYWFYHWCLYVVPHVPGLYPTWASFKEHVCLIVMGDDVIYSYSNLVKPYMRQSVVARTFLTLGVQFKYTVDGPAPLHDLEFCSTFFRKYHNVFVPVLKPEKMLTSILCKPVLNPRLCLRRLFSLRVEIFFEPSLLSLVDGLIEYILRDYERELRLPLNPKVKGDDQTLENIVDSAWSHFTIRSHYLEVFG